MAAPSPWSLKDGVDLPDGLSLSGTARLRYESLSGQPRVGLSASDTLTTSRITLLATYQLDWVRLVAEIYDSRAYGGHAAGSVGVNDVNALEPLQAYVLFDLGNRLGAEKFTVQAGRFLLALGSRRLLATEDYRNSNNSYTGVRTDFSLGGTAVTLFYTLPHIILPHDKPGILNNDVTFDLETFDLTMWGGYLERPHLFGEIEGDVTYLHLDQHDAPGRPIQNRSLDTLDARLIRNPKPGSFDYEGEAAYQTGTIRDNLTAAAPRLDVSAWFAHLSAGYTFPAAWSLRLSLQGDYASGDGPGSGYQRFDTLYGLRRADFSPGGIFSAVGRANIVSPAIRIEAIPTARFDLFATYRPMWLASSTDAFSTTGVRDATGKAGNFAGLQVEGRARYWLVPDALVLEANGALLFKGSQLTQSPNSPATGDTAFGAISIMTFF